LCKRLFAWGFTGALPPKTPRDTTFAVKFKIFHFFMYIIFLQSPTVDGSALFFTAHCVSHFAITAPRFCHPVVTGDAAVPVSLA
jgi:hypothetical protein